MTTNDKDKGRNVFAGAETVGGSEQVKVLVRFSRAELSAMMADTGATSNATAVCCFVRKRLSGKGGAAR